MSAPLSPGQFGEDALAKQDDATLLALHGNLTRGLDLARKHIAAGTLDVARGKKSNPPRAAAQLTLALHTRIGEILESRGVKP